MKFVVGITLVVAVIYASAAEDKKEDRPKTFRRVIPADVLRDFPGKCFASVRCEKIDPGKSWELSPYCGRSTCVTSEDGTGLLLELVEDCGPLPKPNPKCKISEKTNKTASFPDCCPIFECEDGAQLEYPKIPMVAPIPPVAGGAKAAETTDVPAKNPKS